ncbi:MAG: PaaI family thioesterase [Bdellovibrionales bacterium]|nr:PaaI family thioesterase [Bdellovibrionales bacterium]
MKPPKVVPHSDWETFFLPFNIGSGRDFFPESGPISMRMAFFRRKEDNHLIGRVWFGEPVEGPPGHVHGGVSTYVLDEAMGSVAWMNRYGCVAKSLAVEFLSMTPIGTDLEVEAWIERIEGKNCFIGAEIRSPEGAVLSRARGVFHRLSRSKLMKSFGDEDQRYDFSQIRFPEDDN